MNFLAEKIEGYKSEKKVIKKAPKFAPAGQSTQLVIGASPEKDFTILKLASSLYDHQHLKRVYYSGYIHVNNDSRLPVLPAPPLLREHRLYQADWLLRFYGFEVNEILNDQNPDLDSQVDPKLCYALRNPHIFPIDINTAPYEMILRIPGIGVKSAKLIVTARRYGKLKEENIRKIGVVWKRAKYFVTGLGPSNYKVLNIDPVEVKRKIIVGEAKVQQLGLFDSQIVVRS